MSAWEPSFKFQYVKTDRSQLQMPVAAALRTSGMSTSSSVCKFPSGYANLMQSLPVSAIYNPQKINPSSGLKVILAKQAFGSLRRANSASPSFSRASFELPIQLVRGVS